MKVPEWIKKIGDMQREKGAIRGRVSQLVEEEYRKHKQYKTLVTSELNYPIIQDLINSAAQGIDVVISFPGGQTMKMTKTIPADALARMRAFGELY
jgi:hypothetical protein